MNQFEKIDYKGGHPLLVRPTTINVKIDETRKQVTLEPSSIWSTEAKVTINADDIVTMSFDEKSKRSVGKAAAGAIIGGVLTGGIGLLVGGALGAHKKDISNLYITIRHNNREMDIVLKAGKKADAIYAAISAIL